MKKLLLYVLVATTVALLYMVTRPTRAEAFEAQANIECPTEARRGPDGRIYVKPGDRNFGTMSDYVGYLSDLYAKGATCLAPKVRPNKAPVDGILGGLGNGVEPPAAMNMQDATRAVYESDNTEMTSAKTKIDKLDDYEYSRVVQTESGSRNNLSRAVKNELMEKYNLDWANLPFNNAERAAAEDEFVAGRLETAMRDPKTGVYFKNMEGGTLLPPDEEAEKMREAKILSAYRPTELSKHTVDNKTETVARLVNEMYSSDKNWEPVVTKTGENKWEVTELRPKPQKESWEDAQTMSLATAEAKGLAHPPAQLDIMDRLSDDPYFDKSGVGDRANNKFWNYKDFNKWTPGLERMFAPTMDNREWY